MVHAFISLRTLISRFRVTVGFTLALVLVEAFVELLFPLFIGLAINGLLEDSYTGVAWLGGLGVAALTVGSARRFFDTRAYARIYTTIATEMVEREQERDAPVSTVSARAALITEFVEFLENSMPLVVSGTIGIVGILIIVATLNLSVFFACLGLLVIIAITFWASSGKNYSLNAGYNDQLEVQVDVLATRDVRAIGVHFSQLMSWNRKLSDLETLNYIVVWLGVVALLVYAPIATIDANQTEYGFAFAVITYVFQYIEGLVTFPIHIQQAIRLQEIGQRLNAPSSGDE